MKWAISVVSWCLLYWSATAFSQEAPSTPPPSPPSKFEPKDQIFSLLAMPKVRRELEIVEHQQRQLDELMKRANEAWKRLQTEMNGEISRKAREIQRLEDDKERAEAWKNYNAWANEIRQRHHATYELVAAAARADCEKILLPHQVERLKQLATQRRNDRSDFRSLLQESFELSEEQRQRLEQLTKKMNKDHEQLWRKFQEEMKNLVIKHKEDMLEVLTPDQRSQWKNGTGEPFDFTPDAVAAEQPAEASSAP